MSERPHLATVLAVALTVASVVNLAILHVVTDRPPAGAGDGVRHAASEGHPPEASRPEPPVRAPLRRSDAAQARPDASRCEGRKTPPCDQDLRTAPAGSAGAGGSLVAVAKGNPLRGGQGTPLHQAATAGGTGLAKVLLKAGADVNARDEYGHTPLHTAAAWGHVELTGLLIAAGADPNAVDHRKETPLHLVAGRPVPPLSVYARVTRMLLTAGARPNLRTGGGDTALHLARHSASRLSLESNVKATGDANEVVSLLRDRGGIE